MSRDNFIRRPDWDGASGVAAEGSTTSGGSSETVAAAVAFCEVVGTRVETPADGVISRDEVIGEPRPALLDTPRREPEGDRGDMTPAPMFAAGAVTGASKRALFAAATRDAPIARVFAFFVMNLFPSFDPA